jgi:uncharacterized protein (TIGR04255 family)
LKQEESYSAIAQKDLEEIFPRPAIREVAFEIRFSPRLRIREQLWQFQDSIANDYPEASEEQMLIHPDRLTPANVFTNNIDQRAIKISPENFVLSAVKYTTYEEFKSEVISRTEQFCRTYSINKFVRMGLRYINHIELGSEEPVAVLERYVNAPLRFDRFDAGAITQLLTEFRLKFSGYQMTIRGALLQVPAAMVAPERQNNHIYVLDLDCYDENISALSLGEVLDRFHEAIQVQFLQHVTEDYKNVMRS